MKVKKNFKWLCGKYLKWQFWWRRGTEGVAFSTRHPSLNREKGSPTLNDVANKLRINKIAKTIVVLRCSCCSAAVRNMVYEKSKPNFYIYIFIYKYINIKSIFEDMIPIKTTAATAALQQIILVLACCTQIMPVPAGFYNF